MFTTTNGITSVISLLLHIRIGSGYLYQVELKLILTFKLIGCPQLIFIKMHVAGWRKKRMRKNVAWSIKLMCVTMFSRSK